MASEERNFRNQYYDKMGFRGVEEKKSLELMLNSDVVDVRKINAFCLRFSLPLLFRPLVWKVLLTVLPPHRHNHDFVQRMRGDQFEELMKCLDLLQLATPETPKSHVFLKMYLLEEGKLGFVDEGLEDRKDNHVFVHIADTMLDIFEEDRDAFFAAISFFKMLKERFEDCFHLLPDCLIKQLHSLEPDSRLMDHLKSVQLFRRLPYHRWFRGCFAGVIPAIALDKIWDKVVAGSCVILAHVGASVLSAHKRPLMTMTTVEEMLAFLETIHSDGADIVVNKALETWYKTPLLKPTMSRQDSPVIIERIL